MAQCTTCGASLKPGANRCVKCGSAVDVAPAAPQSSPAQQYAQPGAAPVIVQPVQYVQTGRPVKNRATAGILAILLGSIGAHKFYLGNTGWGILYLLFCWTGIPAVVGIIEGIVMLTMSEEAFHQKYG